jgi:large subunit ribosomal protein L32e
MTNLLKKKKPQFIRTNLNKKRFKSKWRRPRGMHNKIRLGKRGKPQRPSIGYKSPNSIRGLLKSNKKIFLVSNLKDLEKVNVHENVVLLSSSLGKKKRITILEKCLALNLHVLNIKNVQDYIAKAKESVTKRKVETHKKIEEKKKKESQIK